MTVCRICVENKNSGEIDHSKEYRDGFRSECKRGRRKIVTAWIKSHPERKREYDRNDYQNHKKERLAKAVVYTKAHPEQRRLTTKRYRLAHLEQEWQKHIWNKYRIRLSDYEALLEKQGGTCAICPRSKPVGMKRFSVDHCHKTGRVRGLLCMPCNAGLGNFGDNPYLLSKARIYVKDK